MLPVPEPLGEVVGHERALGWTLGAALAGAALAELAGGVGPLLTLLAFGALGWAASHLRAPGARLAALATGGALLSAPSALAMIEWSLAPAVAALAGATLAAGGWLLDGRLLALGGHLDAPDTARAFSSRGLLVVAAAAAGLGLAVTGPRLAVAGTLVAVLAAARWAIARDRVTSLRRWLADVRRGADPVWTVRPRAELEPLASRLPALTALAPLDGVLAPRGEDGPYRTHPRALVPYRAGRPTPSRWVAASALREAGAWLVATVGPAVAGAWPAQRALVGRGLAMAGAFALGVTACALLSWALSPRGVRTRLLASALSAALIVAAYVTFAAG